MTREQLIENVHASAARMVLAVTGGGTQAIADLLAVPGASESILEAMVPYSNASLEQFLGGSVDQACSGQTARSLAMAAFQRAQVLAEPISSDIVFGVSCSAALATNRVKAGPHRAFVTIQTDRFTSTIAIDLDDRSRNRRQEERIVADIILNQIANVSQVTQQLDVDLDTSCLTHEQINAEPQWQQLVLAKQAKVCLGRKPRNPPETRQILFPGAFDPRHSGHVQMAQHAKKTFGAVVEFELSIENVDKPLLDYHSIANRLKQFDLNETIWLTRASTFAQKSLLFPNVTFIVGTDTILRIADVRYYKKEEEVFQAIKTITGQGCRFLVFGRLRSDNFVTLSELSLPGELLAICEEVDPEAFRCDISSTEIRQGNL